VTVLLTDEVRELLGTTAVYHAPEELGLASIRYFALAIGSDPERWRAEAPPTLICETCQLTGLSVPDHLGYLGHSWLLPLPVPCVMVRGGNDYRFLRPVRPGETITITWKLTDMEERKDSAGTPMLVVTATASYSSSSGDTLATNTETLIYRPTEPV
jgi:hypothetical protein